MRICGIKLTHDASIALIDNNKLIFSDELEKLNNSERHTECGNLNVFLEVLEKRGYNYNNIDVFCFDGWHKESQSRIVKKGLNLNLADYGSYITAKSILSENIFNVDALTSSCKSYTHLAGHVASSYCTSPFAKNGEDSFILVWDGGMFPQLFYYNYCENTFDNICNLFSLTSLVYQLLATRIEPFNSASTSDFFSLPGKVMAFSALGSVNEELLTKLNMQPLDRLHQYDNISLADVERFNTQFIDGLDKSNTFSNYKSPDIIATFQLFLENLLISTLKEVCQMLNTHKRNLCFAGGAALNVIWNSGIRASRVFDNVWIPPFPNDAGSAIGVACCEMLKYSKHKALDWNVYSGPSISEGEVSSSWEKHPVSLKELAWILHIYAEPIVFLHENAELGPRALGNRSILAPAVDLSMKNLLNLLKAREFYRPVAPICLEEYAPLIFDPGIPDPYMLFAHKVRDEWKEKVPAICHVDGTARVQTINANQNKKIYELITEYEKLSKIPLLCNTSANFNGKGFFPDVQSAIQWGRTNLIWCKDFLYIKKGYKKYLYKI